MSLLALDPKRVKNACMMVLLGIRYYIETQTLGLYLYCPLFKFTGLKCPACGITTAIIALAHGNVAQAIAANPGLALSLPVLAPFLLLMFKQWLQAKPFDGRAVNTVGILLIIYFVLWGIVRNAGQFL